MRVELSGDGWVELRSPERITESGRRSFKIAGAVVHDVIHASAQERAEAAAISDDYMLAMFIEGWSFGDPLPCAKLDRLGELVGSDYDTIRNAIVAREVITEGTPKKQGDPSIDPLNPMTWWLVPPVEKPSLMDRVFTKFEPDSDVMEEQPNMGAPFWQLERLRWMLEGQEADPTLMPPHWRTYLLVKLTGWSLAEIDAAPADTLDWLLKIDDVVGTVMQDKAKAASS